MFNLNVNMASIRVLSTPLMVIGASIVGLISVFNFLFPKVPEKLSDINGLQTDMTSLDNKIDVLSSFNADVTGDRSDITYLALPDSNPAAVVISQVKKILSENRIQDIKEFDFTQGTITPSGVHSAKISVKFDAPETENIANIFYGFQQIAPIITIDKVKIDKRNAVASIETELLLYWADLPLKLPEIKQAVNGLTAQEKETLDRVLGYSLPSISASSPASPATDRLNPFN